MRPISHEPREPSPLMRTDSHYNFFNELEEVDVNLRDNHGITFLMRAIASKDESKIEELLLKGSDIKAYDNHGKTVLRYALESENYSLISRLIINLLENKDEKYVIRNIHDFLFEDHNSAERNSPIFLNKIKLLAELNKEFKDIINIRDHEGKTFLMNAICETNYQDVDLLLQIAIEIDLTACDYSGNSVLMYAVQSGDQELVLSILNHPLIPKTENDYLQLKNEKGNTPLMLAIVLEYNGIVNILLEHGAETDIKNENFDSALTLALEYNYILIPTLLEHETDKNLIVYFRKEFLYASLYYNPYLTCELLGYRIFQSVSLEVPADYNYLALIKYEPNNNIKEALVDFYEETPPIYESKLSVTDFLDNLYGISYFGKDYLPKFITNNIFFIQNGVYAFGNLALAANEIITHNYNNQDVLQILAYSACDTANYAFYLTNKLAVNFLFNILAPNDIQYSEFAKIIALGTTSSYLLFDNHKYFKTFDNLPINIVKTAYNIISKANMLAQIHHGTKVGIIAIENLSEFLFSDEITSNNSNYPLYLHDEL